MKEKEITEYGKKLMQEVFKSMTTNEQEVLLKFAYRVAIVHLGLKEVMKIVNDLKPKENQNG